MQPWPCSGIALLHLHPPPPPNVVQMAQDMQARVQEGLRPMLSDGRVATPQLLQHQEKVARNEAARAEDAQDQALRDAGGLASPVVHLVLRSAQQPVH